MLIKLNCYNYINADIPNIRQCDIIVGRHAGNDKGTGDSGPLLASTVSTAVTPKKVALIISIEKYTYCVE